MKALKAWLLHFLDLLESIRLSPYSIRPYTITYYTNYTPKISLTFYSCLLSTSSSLGLEIR